MQIIRELTVVCVHGEGDRDVLKRHLRAANKAEMVRLAQQGQEVPAALYDPDPDPGPPHVMAVLRCPDHENRLELPLKTWDEVEAFKALAGYDAEKSHWKHGAKIPMAVG